MALVEVARKTVELGTVAVVVPVPQGSIGTIGFWNPNTEDYQTTIPKYVQGQIIGISAPCRNDGAANQKMRLDIVVTSPTGGQTSTSGDTRTLSPGVTLAWIFSWETPTAGIYKAELVLYAEAV